MCLFIKNLSTLNAERLSLFQDESKCIDFSGRDTSSIVNCQWVYTNIRRTLLVLQHGQLTIDNYIGYKFEKNQTFTFKASRNPFPNKLNASTSNMMAMPGARASMGLWVMIKLKFSLIMSPQLG
jgi:hypothetical protein